MPQPSQVEGALPPRLLRLSVTAEAAGLDERALVERMRRIFPRGIEETYDESGRFEVAAYEAPPITLPSGLGSWRIEPVDDARVRTWEEQPHGVTIAGRLWVGPPSEPPPPGLPTVIVDSRQAFGSGAHATTYGCLELLCEVEPPVSVLDVGCGSGVLAIAAAKLGHAPVRGCDNDPLAIGVAKANAAANGVEVEFFVADAVQDPLPAADLWVANLLGGPLWEVLAGPDAPARVIASGLVSDEELVAPAYEIEQRVDRAGWQALALRRR
jgi:ribosomal protein L11 methyltransferase